MTWTKNSSNWANGDVPDEADLDAYEDGIYRAHIMADLAGLGIGKLSQTASGPSLLMHLWRKDSAFTFGTAPKTSDGYLRTPGGAPWGADSISGRSRDRTVTAGTYTGTTANSLIVNKLFLLPAFNASITVTRIDVQGSFGFRTNFNTKLATLDKVGLQVVFVAADGTETNIGSEVYETTTAGESSQYFTVAERFLSSTGLSQAVAATERLGFRLKMYGHTSDAAAGIEGAICCDFAPRTDVISTATSSAFQLQPTPVAVWFT